MTVRAYECNVIGTNWQTVIHAQSAGKARYKYWLDVHDYYENIKITDIKVRSLRGFVQTEKFRHTAEYRDVPFAKIGMRVQLTDDDSEGIIVDSSSSANFLVLFTKGKHKGHTLDCHPNWKIRYLAEDGSIIKEFGD